jgi:hypothetical protein
MILNNTIVNSLLEQVNKKGLAEVHSKYPRDFELYMCALELVDESNTTVDYFAFPIMPNNISKTESEATTMEHSLSGITVFNKTGFIPDDITISGDFGRSLKLIPSTNSSNSLTVANDRSIAKGFYTSEAVNSGVSNKVDEFAFGIKTGYGCIKILQSIIHKAKSRSPQGSTYKLFFYNPALGENYLVIPSKNPLTLSQNVQSNNMIWQYNLTLSIIADLEDVVDAEVNNVNSKKLQYNFTADKVLSGIGFSSAAVLKYVIS